MSCGSSAGHLVEGGLDDRGGQVVGADVRERALEGAPDGRAGGGDDHCLGHGGSCAENGVRSATATARAGAPGRRAGPVRPPPRGPRARRCPALRRAAADQRQPPAQPGQPAGTGRRRALARPRRSRRRARARGRRRCAASATSCTLSLHRHAARHLRRRAASSTAGQQRRRRPGRSPRRRGGSGRPTTARAARRTPGRAGRRGRPRCRRPRRPRRSGPRQLAAGTSGDVRSGCSSGSTVPRSGQVPTTTWAPAARSVRDGAGQVARGLAGRHPVGDVVGADHDRRRGRRGRRSARATWASSVGAARADDRLDVAAATRRPSSRASPPASSAPGVCSARSAPRPAALESPSDREAQRRVPRPAAALGAAAAGGGVGRLADRRAGEPGLDLEQAPDGRRRLAERRCRAAGPAAVTRPALRPDALAPGDLRRSRRRPGEHAPGLDRAAVRWRPTTPRRTSVQVNDSLIDLVGNTPLVRLDRIGGAPARRRSWPRSSTSTPAAR